VMSDQDSTSRLPFFLFGGAFTFFGGILLFNGSKEREKLEWIKKTPYTPLGELEKKLKEAGNEPIYVKTSGKIDTEFPIVAEISKEKCAMYEKKIIGVSYGFEGRTRNSSFDSWSPDSLIRKSPFFIHDSNEKGVTKVYVKPFDGQPALELVHMHEEKFGNALLSVVLGPFFSYPYKLIHTEHVLPLGRTLLALGEVSYTPVDGTISIGRSKTQPSVLSLSREDEFIDELSARANTHVTLGSILTLGGLATIAGATLFLPR
jgi:hypothetical protein